MKGKIISSFFIALILTFGGLKSVEATDFNTILKTDIENVEKGDVVPVILGLNFKDCKDGVYVYKGTLDYDKNVFEYVKEEDFESLNSYQDVFYNDRTQEFIVTSLKGSLENQDFLKVNLKAKDKATINNTVITIKDSVISYGEDDVKEEVESRVVVQNYKTENTVINESQNYNSSNLDLNNTENTEKKLENLEYDSVNKIYYSNKEVGSNKIIVLVFILIVIILIGLFIFWKMKNKKEKLKNKDLLSVLLAIGLVAVQSSMLVSAIEKKGELTGDNLIDYQDVMLLQKYLIDIENIKESKLDNADLDHNKKITITDLALLIKKVQEELKYDVNIKTINLDYYPNKNSFINYEFNAEVSYDEIINSIIVNGKEYAVTFDKANKTYTAKIDSGNTVGIETLKISKVKLENGKEVNVNLEEKVEVLKDLPTITDYQVVETPDKSMVNINFTVNDKDNSIISGEVIIKDNDNKIVKQQNITVGKNNFEAILEENKLYNVTFKILYDLDTNVLNKNENKEYLIENKELKLNLAYNFNFKDLKTSNKYGDENKCFNKEDDIYLSFSSENNSKYIPEYLSINNVLYKIESYKDKYIVNIGKLNSVGNNTLKVTKVILNNGKAFDLNESVNIVINKDLPKIENIQVEEKDNELNISFETKDSDSSVNKMQLIVKDLEGNTIFTKVVDKTTNEKIKLDNSVQSFVVCILADYTLSNNNSLVDKVLYTKEFEREPIVEIKLVNTNKAKFEKNQLVEIIYKIETNKKENIEKLQINNAVQTAYKIGANEYKTIIALDNIAGIKDILLQKVIFTNGELEVNHKTNVEVLKDIPKVKNFILEENNKAKKINVKFNVEDLDNAFKSGKIVLTSNEGEKIEKEFTTKDNLYFDFDVKDGMKYTVEIFLSYSRDKASSEIINNKLVFDSTFTFELDYKLQVSNPKTVNSNKEEQQYFNRDENIYLTFNSTNASSYEPKTAVINGKKYNVYKQGNLYIVNLGIISNLGENNINLTSVVLENGKEFSVDEKIKVVIRKFKPEILNLDSYIINNNINVSFEVKDSDNALKNIKLIIKNNLGKIVHSEDVLGSKVEKEIKINEDLEKYIVEVNASYSLSNIDNEVDKTLVSKEFNNPNRVVISNSTVSSKYVKKGSNIEITYTIDSKRDEKVSKLLINNKEYEVNNLGNGKYKASVYVGQDSGIKEFNLTKVIFEDKIVINTNNTTTVEVLKDSPEFSDITYTTKGNDEVVLKFNVKDQDNVLDNANIIVNDGLEDIIKSNSITKGNNELVFKLTYSENYKVKINASYDLDSDKNNNLNSFDNLEVNSKEIYIEQELLEYKDIEEVKLYTKYNDEFKEVRSINVNTFNPSDYIAKVIMKDLPNTYFEIEKGEVVGKDFMLTLKQDNVVSYNNNQKDSKLVVKYSEVKDGQAVKMSLDSLIKEINKNPNGEYSLTQDLDASNYKGESLFNVEFKGKLNGNGYTIKNLNGSLFASINGATIENLFIENANVTKSRGIITTSASNTTLINTHIKDSTLNINNDSGAGAFIGNGYNITIKQCSATNVNVKSERRTGGIIGVSNGTSTIENSYIQGTVSSKKDLIGGIVAEVEGTMTIRKCYSDIKLDVIQDNTCGGIVGFKDKEGTVSIYDTISLADGNYGNRVIGYGSISSSSRNVYEVRESKLKTNVSGQTIKDVSKNYVNDNFFKYTLNFDEKVWKIENTNTNNLPILISSIKNTSDEDTSISTLDRIKTQSDYDNSREIAYSNMYKLSPFIDAKYLVRDGNRVDKNSLLNTVEIKKIYPYDINNKVIIGINTNNYDDIKKIKIVYENDKVEEYNVTFDKVIGNTAKYTIDKLNINYSYNKYILNLNIDVVKDIIESAKKLTYTDIESTTASQESRLYRDYYNENINNNLENIITSILQSQEDYNIYIDNTLLKDFIKYSIYDLKLEKILYTYNYFDKWYNFDIGGLKISEEILLNGNYSLMNWVEDTFAIDSNKRGTNATIDFYSYVIRPKYNMDIVKLLEHYITTIGGEVNGNTWFAKNFKGMLYEQPLKGKENIVNYRAWYMLTNRNHLLLPVLSAPQEDMYLVSVPSQLIIGSANAYKEYLNNGSEAMMKILKNSAELIGNFYSTSSQFIENSEQKLNSKVHIQYDTRFNFPEEAPSSGNQNAGTTEDPVIKWVYEAVGSMAASNGSGAYANGTDVYWVAYNALGSDFAFRIFSHETAHNQDGYYFYEGNGRRGGAEENADGTISQDIGESSFVFNITRDYSYSQDISTNFTLDRISGKDKIQSYYHGMFETFYLLDYLTAQAFLQLTPEEQSKVAVQASYEKADGSTNTTGGEYTKYTKLSAEEFKKMNLKTVEDLWDNRILLMNEGTIKNNLYGQGSHYNVYWYQPHNDNGRPDSRSLQRIGFEMLAYAGYSDGFVEYRSSKAKTDLSALRKITKDDQMTFKQFKMDRYKEVYDNLDKITYFNVDEAIKMYKEALENDAKTGRRDNTNAVRSTLYGLVKRVTNDFEGSTVYEANNVVNITTAQQLLDEISKNSSGNYNIVNNLDFTGIDSVDGYYINKEFFGVINGNGNKITGLNNTLFKKISYSSIKNIVIDSPNYDTEDKSILAETVKNSMFISVKASNVNKNIPMRINKEGYEHFDKNSEISMGKIKINTAQELIDIGKDELSLSMGYELASNIDLSTIKLSKSSYITGEFTGQLDGKGYSIINGTRPIFNSISGSVKGVGIKDFTLNYSSESTIGALASSSNGATIEKVNLENITINGKQEIGSLIGKADKTTIKLINASNIDITNTDYYAGGLIGKSISSDISDISIQGKVFINRTYNGGVIGTIENTKVNNVFSKVDVTGPKVDKKNNQNSGLVGFINGNASLSSITNSIVVGNMGDNIYKTFTSDKYSEILIIQKSLKNVYEYIFSSGMTTINSETRSSISSARDTYIVDKNFYMDKLYWSETIWDFSTLLSGGYPTIKN